MRESRKSGFCEGRTTARGASTRPVKYGFIGELSLDGRLRACRGILPMIIAGQKRGIKKIIVPEANFKEASLVHGVEILGFMI